MRNSDFDLNIGIDSQFTKKAAGICEEMGFAPIDVDEEWENWQNDEGDGLVRNVSIGHDDGWILVEFIRGDELLSRKEFNDAEGDTLADVKRALI